MIQKQFANRACQTLESVPEVLGIAAGGSWITQELDEFSDLDLIIVTKEQLSGSKDAMTAIADKLGNLISAFTGEHVGEPRLLICLFDRPLLHVDLKFVTLEEFETRVENPAILFDKEGQLENVIANTSPNYPQPDFQWIEDRFWTWVHYALLKIGRGEYFEAMDFLAYIRTFVIAPLMQVKNGELPRGLRKVEFNFPQDDIDELRKTIASDNAHSLMNALEETVRVYQDTRKFVFTDAIKLRKEVEFKVMDYMEQIQKFLKQ